MTSRADSGEGQRGGSRLGERMYEVPDGTFAWTRHGALAGVLGAATVAVFFLGLDAVRGHPLWTPHALGSALFLGEAVPLEASPEPAVVAGYTALHGAVFVAMGLLAAAEIFLQRRVPTNALGLATIAVLFFAACEAVFLTFSAIFNPALVDELGGGFVAAANLLTALAMSAYLVAAARRAFPGSADPGAA